MTNTTYANVKFFDPKKVWAWNLIGLIAITLWAGGLTALLFYLLNLGWFSDVVTMSHSL